MDPNQKYSPRLSTVKLENGNLFSPPIEDLDPLLDLAALEKLLGYQATEISRKIRGL
jgi:hypothetical protein